MFDLGTVGSAVVLDGSQYFGTLNQLHGRTNATMMQVKQIMTRALGVYGAYKLFKDAAKAGMEFGDEMGNVQSIADNLDMGKVRRNLLGLNANLGKSTNLANSFYYAYSAGMRGTERDLVRFTASMSRGAKAVNSEQVPYMDAATTTINSYGLAIKDAGMINDWFYQIVKQGKAVGPELAQGLGMIVGTAAQAGISLDELGAGLATLTQIMPTSQAIVGLNQSILAFVSPTKEAKEAAAELGIELTASALKSKGLVESFKEIEAKAGDNVEALSAMFGNIRAFRVAAQLAGEQGEKFGGILEKFKDKAGTSLKAFEIKVKTTGQAWRNAMVDWNKSLIQLEDTISPVVRSLAALISTVSQNRGALIAATVVTGGIGLVTARWLIQIARLPGSLLKVSASLQGQTTIIDLQTAAIERNKQAFLARRQTIEASTKYFEKDFAQSQLMDQQNANAAPLKNKKPYFPGKGGAYMYNSERLRMTMDIRNAKTAGVHLRSNAKSMQLFGTAASRAAIKTVALNKSIALSRAAMIGFGNASKMALGNIGLVVATATAGYEAGKWLYDNLLKETVDADQLKQVFDAQKKINSAYTEQEKYLQDQKKNHFNQRLEWLKKEGRISSEIYEKLKKQFNNQDYDTSGRAYLKVRKMYNNESDRKGWLKRENEKIQKYYAEAAQKRIESVRRHLSTMSRHITNQDEIRKAKIGTAKSSLFLNDKKYDTSEQQKIASMKITSQEKLLKALEGQLKIAREENFIQELKDIQQKYNSEVEMYKQMLADKKQLDKKAYFESFSEFKKAAQAKINSLKFSSFSNDGKLDLSEKTNIANKTVELQKKVIDRLSALYKKALSTGSQKYINAIQERMNREVEAYRQAIERKKQLDKDYAEEKKKNDPRYQLQQLRKGYKVRQAILDRDGGRAGSDRGQIRDYLKVSTPEERKEYQKILASAMKNQKLGTKNDREQAAFIKFTEIMKCKQAKDDAKLSEVTKKMETIIEKLEKLSNGGSLVLN